MVFFQISAMAWLAHQLSHFCFSCSVAIRLCIITSFVILMGKHLHLLGVDVEEEERRWQHVTEFLAHFQQSCPETEVKLQFCSLEVKNVDD